jgi:DNA-binding HxlR family transcriptional regulator
MASVLLMHAASACVPPASSAKTELDGTGSRQDNPDMSSYRQYCPLARATELVGERWSLLIVRNLMFGATTFSAIANGVPHMSRSMLVKRLHELERNGIISTQPKTVGQGLIYGLTDAGRDLVGVVDALTAWGTEWADIGPEHTDPAFALWAWCQVQLERSALPTERTVVAFTFPDERSGNRHYWLLVADQEAELCHQHPGGDVAAEVVAGSRAFIDWHRGVLPWREALRSGAISIRGRRTVVRDFPSWNSHRVAIGSSA